MGIFQSKQKGPTAPSLVPKPMELATSVIIAKAMYVLVRAKVPDILHEYGPLKFEEIADKAGMQPDACSRLLRACESQGLFSLNRETEKWSNNQNTDMLRDVTGSMSTMVNHVMNESYLGYIHMESAVMSDGQTDRTSWDMYSGGKSFWEWLDGHEFELHNFNQVMTDNSMRNMPFVMDGYDWKGLGDGQRVVDIGGGKGHLLKGVLDINGSIKPVVFDTPKMIDDAKDFWKDYSGTHAVKLVSGDFFKSVPEGEVYLLKHILHDWSDDKAVDILKVIHTSASKVQNSKVLIIEVLLDEEKPLSPIQAFLDIQMLALVNGKERSKSQWASVLERSGFQLDKIFPTKGELVVIEATPV